jgi:indolepyruvate decarboxylase
MRLAESLLHALQAHGAREIFGIPGDFALPLFKVIEESRILPLYTLSHEPAVGFAADAAARVNCGLGVAAVTYGAGALNVVNAVAGAYAEKSPVVVVSGAPGKDEAGTGLLLHHQAKTLDSQFRIFAEITCDQARLDDARRAPGDIARVLQRCRTQSRPVYLELRNRWTPKRWRRAWTRSWRGSTAPAHRC